MNCSQKSTPYRLTRSLGQGAGDGVGHEAASRNTTTAWLTSNDFSTQIARRLRATPQHFRFWAFICGNFWFHPFVRDSRRPP